MKQDVTLNELNAKRQKAYDDLKGVINDERERDICARFVAFSSMAVATTEARLAREGKTLSEEGILFILQNAMKVAMTP